MVAYSFQKRFVPGIQAGTKRHTIRAERRRHARPGEPMQLYSGLRTKHCRLIAAPICEAVEPVRMVFSREAAAELFVVGGRYLPPSRMEAFARADGFLDIADMARFWWAAHPQSGGERLTFEGVLLRWLPLAPAAPLSLEEAA